MENLEDLKVGDKVILISRYSIKVCKVERLTKTQVIVDGIKFSKANGHSTENRGWYSKAIRKASDKEIKEVEEINKRNTLIEKIKGYPLEKLSTEELENIYKIINK